MLRRVVLSVPVLAAAMLLGRALLGSITPLTSNTPPADLLTGATQNLILTLGLLAAAWYGLTASAVMLTATLRTIGAAPARLERAVSRYGAPLLRRVATWTTLSTIALASPAMATNVPQAPTSDTSPSAATEETTSRNSAFLVDLGWSASHTAPAEETRTSGSSSTSTRSAEDTQEARKEDTQEARTESYQHLVQPGDTLWGIAETHLHQTTDHITAEDVAAHWPLWHEANRATIGSDPHLIIPGMTLHAPTSESS